MAFPLDGFQFIFCCLTVKTIYSKWRSIFTDESDALSRAVLKRNSKLTWKHLWPRVYFVLSEVLPYKLWFTRKKKRPKYIWPAHLDLLNSMNLVNVLHAWSILINCSNIVASDITYPISRTLSNLASSLSDKTNLRCRKHFFFISSALLWKPKDLRSSPLSCNNNNYITCNWPNSAFFAENIRQSCTLFLSNWNKETDEE